MNRAPIYVLPAEDAPISEWTRPLSATLKTRRTNFFGDPMETSGDHDGSGALQQKLRRLVKSSGKPKRRYAPKTEIDHAEVFQMHKDGMTPTAIGKRLGVPRDTISRILRGRHDG